MSNNRFCARLKKDRVKRQNRRAQAWYRRKHPSHKMQYGHRFQRNEAYAKEFSVCKVCGRDR